MFRPPSSTLQALSFALQEAQELGLEVAFETVLDGLSNDERGLELVVVLGAAQQCQGSGLCSLRGMDDA